MRHTPFSSFALSVAIPLAAATSICGSASLARADEPVEHSRAEELPPEPPRPIRQPPARDDVSLTISPFHLALPVVQLTLEIRAHDNLGVALVGGYGATSIQSTTTAATGATVTSTTSIALWEVGARANAYVVGNFDDGMIVGAQLLYLGATSGGVSYQGGAAAQGTSIGGYIGYKLATRVGFTFLCAIGAQNVFLSAASNDGNAQASDSKVLPLLILDVGWSF